MFFFSFVFLNNNLANGEISFSVVDGEPYVKVGADSPRPFSMMNLDRTEVITWSNSEGIGSITLNFKNKIHTAIIILNNNNSMSAINISNGVLYDAYRVGGRNQQSYALIIKDINDTSITLTATGAGWYGHIALGYY